MCTLTNLRPQVSFDLPSLHLNKRLFLVDRTSCRWFLLFFPSIWAWFDRLSQDRQRTSIVLDLINLSTLCCIIINIVHKENGVSLMLNMFLLNNISNYSSIFYNQQVNKRTYIIVFWKKRYAFIGNGDIDHYMTLHCYSKRNERSRDILFFSLKT